MITVISLVLAGNIIGFFITQVDNVDLNHSKNILIIPYVLYSFDSILNVINILCLFIYHSNSICVIFSLLVINVVTFLFIIIFGINIKTYFAIFTLCKFFAYVFLITKADFINTSNNNNNEQHSNQRNNTNNFLSVAVLDSPTERPDPVNPYSPPKILPPLENDWEFYNRDDICCICFDKEIVKVDIKCSHGDKFCNTCIKRFKICPICRTPI